MGLESPRLHGKPQGVEGALDQESSPWLLTLLGGQLTEGPCLSALGKTMTVSKAGSRPCCGVIIIISVLGMKNRGLLSARAFCHSWQ